MKNYLEEPSNPNPKSHRNENEEEDEVFMRAMKIINAAVFPMVLKIAFEMGIIDAIFAAGEGSWLSPAEIAARLPTNPRNPKAPVLLDRMLRSLASFSIVKCRTVRTGETESRVYGAEPICKFFVNGDKGDSGSLLSLFMMHHCDVTMEPWKHLKDEIVDGGYAFGRAHGMRIFEYMGKDEQLSELFQKSMSESTVVILKKVLEAYKGFKDVNVLVDVGGGLGTALTIITSKYPKMKGINFDLATALGNTRSYPGVEHVVGDMFKEIPKGDAIFLQRILHDWSDEECLKILKNCWKALSDKGKVVILEIVLPNKPKSGDVYSKVCFNYDLLILTHTSTGRERTQIEFEELAINSGFSRCEFVCRVSPYSVIELHKEEQKS